MSRSKLIKREVCNLFNTTKEFLRHYENKGLLKPEITDKNYRLYGYEDIQKIREIYLFKDLDLSIDEMSKIKKQVMSKNDYIHLLKDHHKILEEKTKQLVKTQNDIKQLLDIIESDNSYSFLIRNNPDRHFILTDFLGEEDLLSPKNYYNKYKKIIESSDYSEREFQILYNYSDLEKGDFIEGKIAVELNKSTTESYKMESGTYLSVFYPFKHGDFKGLKEVKEDIEIYMKNNNIKRVSDKILEKEHPELSIFLEDNVTIFELQFKIEGGS